MVAVYGTPCASTPLILILIIQMILIKNVFGPPLPRHRSYGSACEIQRNVLPYRSRGLVRLTVLQTDQYLECCMRIRETKHDTEMLLKQKQC
jgi:hypothetical protein